MSNAAFRQAARRQYVQWAFEIATAVAALIWWKWSVLAIWWTPQESIEARAVALARLAGMVFPSEMLQRMTVIVDMQGHVSTIAAILDTIRYHGAAYAALRADAWAYLLLPPAVGLLSAVILLYAGHRIRAARELRARHVRGAKVDDCT